MRGKLDVPSPVSCFAVSAAQSFLGFTLSARPKNGAGDVRGIDVPDPGIQQPTDAIVRVVRACICGSDLHPYHSMPVTPGGSSMGHEFIGVVEDAGDDVTSVREGDLVIAPFAWSDGTCDYCREGLQTSCRHGGFWNANGVGGGQAEAVRVPLADGTLVTAPVEEDSPLIPSLLTLSDVYGTGYHAAIRARPWTSVPECRVDFVVSSVVSDEEGIEDR